MSKNMQSLSAVFDGWDGYQTSILHAVQLLNRQQLTYRPAPHLRTPGEIASHLAFGRIDWFSRMPAPGSLELARKASEMGGEAVFTEDLDGILFWLEATSKMIADTLNQWTVDDLARTYLHTYQGKTYAVSYQWTVWRILTHDVHHGGELAYVLGVQGIAVPELGDLFGHITYPPLAE